MEKDNKVVVSKIIDVLKGMPISDSNKLVLLMPFGLIAGYTIEADETNQTNEINDVNEKSNPVDVIVLRDVEILPFMGSRVNMPIITVMTDHILGLSLGNFGGQTPHLD